MEPNLPEQHLTRLPQVPGSQERGFESHCGIFAGLRAANNKMPAPLLDLPREIRDHIYRYVLVSPTGVISLSKTSFDQSPIRYRIWVHDVDYYEDIKLSFVRTCRQIYTECRNKLWEYNTLDIEFLKMQYNWDGNDMCDIHAGVKDSVRSLRMDTDFLNEEHVRLPSGEELPVMVTKFQELKEWKNLRKLTLLVRHEFKGYWAQYTALFALSYRSAYDELTFLHNSYVEPLRTARELLPHVDRSLVFDLDTPTLSESGEPDRGFDKNPNPLLQDWHNAFGGRLWVDGMLCYEDNIEKQKAFLGPFTIECKGEFCYSQRDLACYQAAKRYAALTKNDHKELFSWVVAGLGDNIGGGFFDCSNLHPYNKALLSLHRRFGDVAGNRESLKTESFVYNESADLTSGNMWPLTSVVVRRF